MTKIKYELEIDAPLGKVYEYYTDPENIKKTWPSDIVKNQGIYLELKMKKVLK
jgi:uncharacterized protein YndB with AHSA1/START domain